MKQNGKVILAGAGPGDPDLITVKAAWYISKADTIICDRLVSDALIKQYARPDATIIISGKEGYRRGSIPQAYINNLLLEHYHPEKLLLRLKGGDVAFFSNVFDELITLAEHNIPYEIVPGITAASGASALCGIPLTARGYADSVRFITYVNKEQEQDHYWQELANTEDTLVCYMSGEKSLNLIRKLYSFGMNPEKEIAIIEQATTPFQKTTIFSINDAAQNQKTFTSPTLIIIGRVVQLYQRFQWKENSHSGQLYFKSVGWQTQSLKGNTTKDQIYHT